MRQIQDQSKSQKMASPRLAIAEMEHGQRRAKKATSAKLHQKSDIDYCFIRELEATTARVHDSQIDLSKEGEAIIRDRGYFGAPARGNDFTMPRRITDPPPRVLDRKRNRLISKLRSSGKETSCSDKKCLWGWNYGKNLCGFTSPAKGSKGTERPIMG